MQNEPCTRTGATPGRAWPPHTSGLKTLPQKGPVPSACLPGQAPSLKELALLALGPVLGQQHKPCPSPTRRVSSLG